MRPLPTVYNHHQKLRVSFVALSTELCDNRLLSFFCNPDKNKQTNTSEMKKALGETQTLRAGCSKAEPKVFAPLQTPSRQRRTAKI